MSAETLLAATLLVQTMLTIACGCAVAGHFLRLLAGEMTPGRRTAAMALALCGAGAAVQAAAVAAGGLELGVAMAAGLPSCLGQALAALLVLRGPRPD
jgi:hypothetical protein